MLLCKIHSKCLIMCVNFDFDFKTIQCFLTLDYKKNRASIYLYKRLLAFKIITK